MPGVPWTDPVQGYTLIGLRDLERITSLGSVPDAADHRWGQRLGVTAGRRLPLAEAAALALAGPEPSPTRSTSPEGSPEAWAGPLTRR